MTLEEKINSELDITEWWHQENSEVLVRITGQLMALGVPEDIAINVICTAYAAGANEYGG